ncbi:MAG: hypothetical protein PUP46_07105 [Endozoicomonas sp. (ex Botrylloides leachii)]|nr:hypothetical protein [Endozoicomonas sp. (ex Botrylloides leachii)]
MESILIIVIGAFALYYLNLKQDQAADQLIGEAFSRFERIYNGVIYSCYDATVVIKTINRGLTFPFIPSPNYHARALCQTEQEQWFWFDASIKYMKLNKINITPTSKEEAFQVLKDDPESLQRYFPNYNKQQST